MTTSHVKARRSKQIDVEYRATDRIGSPDAETDPQLEAAFVDTGLLTTLLDTSDARCVVTGRTGAGKSALLVFIEKREDRVKRVDPLGVAIKHLQYASLIPTLAAEGINFDAFYKFLWRHIILMEVLQSWQADRSTMRAMIDRFLLGKRVSSVLALIDEWSNGDEYLSAEARSTRMIDTFNARVKESIGQLRLGQIAIERVVNGKTTDMRRDQLNETQRARLQGEIARISGERADSAFNFLPDLLDDRQKQYYVLIDHLDTAWIDSAFAYDLIEALINVAGEFARIPNVKVIIALREDLIESIRNTEDRGRRQWEKLEGLIHRLAWSGEQLVELVDRRLILLLQKRYTQEVSLNALLPQTEKHGRTPINYILDRTHYRPRDLIAFVNLCLSTAAAFKKHTIGWDVIELAEAEYSRGRLEALREEWNAVFPGLQPLFTAFSGMREAFTIRELATNESHRISAVLKAGEEMAAEIESDGPVPLPVDLVDMIEAPYDAMWTVIVTALLRIGFLGIKPSPQEPFIFVTDGRGDIINGSPVPMDAPLVVHPMFAKALGCDPRAAIDPVPEKTRAPQVTEARKAEVQKPEPRKDHRAPKGKRGRR
jgi:hypothetical protein